jgi:hypothetical protein
MENIYALLVAMILVYGSLLAWAISENKKDIRKSKASTPQLSKNTRWMLEQDYKIMMEEMNPIN